MASQPSLDKGELQGQPYLNGLTNGHGHVDPLHPLPKSATLPPALDIIPTSEPLGSLFVNTGLTNGNVQSDQIASPVPLSANSPALSPTPVRDGPSRRSSHLRLDGAAVSSSSHKPAPVSPRTPFPHDQRRLLSHHLLQHPEHTVKKAAQVVFPRPNALMRLARRFQIRHSVINGLSKKEEAHWETEAEVLRKKAGWKARGEAGEGVEMSPLFWKAGQALKSDGVLADMGRCTCPSCRPCNEIHCPVSFLRI